MSKLNLTQLRNALQGLEIDLIVLDDRMGSFGYYVARYDGNEDDIMNQKRIIYTAIDTNEAEIVISFEIAIDARETDEPAFHSVVFIDDIAQTF